MAPIESASEQGNLLDEAPASETNLPRKPFRSDRKNASKRDAGIAETAKLAREGMETIHTEPERL